jgi:hypothetical protein
MLGYTRCPPTFGGAIGALFGKTPHGVFWGFAAVVLLVVIGMIGIAIYGLPVD